MGSLIQYIKESREEFRKISWPPRKQTARLTAYVIGVSLIVGIYVSGIDYLFKEALKLILNR